jgi:hypothetical protein
VKLFDFNIIVTLIGQDSVVTIKWLLLFSFNLMNANDRVLKCLEQQLIVRKYFYTNRSYLGSKGLFWVILLVSHYFGAVQFELSSYRPKLLQIANWSLTGPILCFKCSYCHSPFGNLL